MAVYAYLRVSTDQQTTDNQRLQIVKQGFYPDEWFSDTGVSGKTKAMQRPVFTRMMRKAKEGDTICVLTLDRLGRNTEDILFTIRMCSERGVALRVMALDGTDLTSKSGKILVTLMALIAEIERDDISTRTKQGLARAKEEGIVLGRPPTVAPEKLKELLEGRASGMTIDQLVAAYGVPRITTHRLVNLWKDRFEEYVKFWNDHQEQAEKRGVLKSVGEVPRSVWSGD